MSPVALNRVPQAWYYISKNPMCLETGNSLPAQRRIKTRVLGATTQGPRAAEGQEKEICQAMYAQSDVSRCLTASSVH